MAHRDVSPANQAWEALLRAQSTLARKFVADDVWEDVSELEYDVLYTLSKAPAGLRMSEINQRVMVTQPGMSKLVSRLEKRGLLRKSPDPEDARASRVLLTEQGQVLQRRTGLRHGRKVAEAMTHALDADQLRTLRDLCSLLIEKGPTTP
ncbi:MarR family winged helix-turn-helix transcriptional regulator [Amycolatopsis sp. cmx-11-12]|jgi:DNA-binding MarR family transcriptional regulator|uniref:MarR family winged helix-turn-helix transcriptional regulator n=1 Tax=Amycolatopsis sp. cmx-11-12 TaxID=2785795 RepID=UPI003917D9DF